VGFRIGPRINAAGRMDTARAVIELFTTADPEQARKIAADLDRLNAERQQAEQGVIDEIVTKLGVPPPPDVLPFLVLEGHGWPPGVIGIVASRIVERFHRPTLVLSVNADDGLATGSGRSIPGFHLLESLESVPGIFERFGGHKQAAGCTIRAERVGALREALNDYALNVLGPDDFIPQLQLDVELGLESINDALMERIAGLGPHGMGNPTPVFSTSGARLAAEPRLLKERHLKLRLGQRDAAFTAMGWRMGERLEELRSGAALDAAYNIEWDDSFGGWRLNLKDFRPSEGAAVA
jgi:single-stranded-DNA-specific exonuclease